MAAAAAAVVVDRVAVRVGAVAAEPGDHGRVAAVADVAALCGVAKVRRDVE